MSRNLPSAWKEELATGGTQNGWSGLVRAYYSGLVDRSGKQCLDRPMYGARLLAELGEADAMYQCLDLALDTHLPSYFPPTSARLSSVIGVSRVFSSVSGEWGYPL